MTNLIEKEKEVIKRKSIVFPLFIYWLILVIWQNVSEYTPRSSVATIIKVILLAYLAFEFIRDGIKLKYGNFFLWMLFTSSTMYLISSTEGERTTQLLIYYYFPIIFSFLTLLCRSDTEVDKKSYLTFLKLVIVTVLYMALYSLIFQTSKFTGFLSLSSSYGHELSSFFVSNHEYGMYLVFAITATIICYQNATSLGVRILYLLLLLLFGVNLAATLSRTSLLACAVIITVFVLISKNSGIKKWFLFFVFIVVLLLLFVPEAQDFFQRIILKENNDAGRFDMWDSAILKFKNASIATKLFGHGYTYISYYLSVTFSHGSLHNMFLHTLLLWGVVGECFLIGVIISSIKKAIGIYKHNRNMSVIFLALVFSTITFMFTNTACIMQSPIDSYMLTVFTIIVPRYVANSIQKGTFEKIEDESENSEIEK